MPDLDVRITAVRENGTPTDSCHPLFDPPTYNHFTGHNRNATDIPGAAVFCLIGLVGGLLGIGGGSLIAPLLLLVGNLRPAQISGTTLATVVVISLVGSGAYASLGHLNLGLAWPIAMGSVVGSVIGALSAKRLSMGLMLAIFLVILPYFALKELWPSSAAPAIGANLVLLGMLGLATGILSGLLGISGASLVVPSLVGFFLINHHEAQGIAMGVALADSLAGALTHARARNINYRLLPYLATPALFGALGGALLSNSFSGSALRIIFGVSLVAVWVMMLARPIKDSVRNRCVSKRLTTPVPANQEKQI